MTPDFEHQRHKPPTELARPRELIVACPPLRSNVNLSCIVRVAGCCGVKKMIVCGNPKIDHKIARDALQGIELSVNRSLPAVLKKLQATGYRLVGLEQATNSKNLHTFSFQPRTVLIVGHERLGLGEDLLKMLDDVIEIPVFGLPHSYNVATATTMALYEFCRQYPH